MSSLSPLKTGYNISSISIQFTPTKTSTIWPRDSPVKLLKGNSRLWFLRRLKLLGASKNTLMDIYKLFCRSVLEYAAPVWAGALTNKNKQDLERVQRNAMRIISDAQNTPYLEFLMQETN